MMNYDSLDLGMVALQWTSTMNNTMFRQHSLVVMGAVNPPLALSLSFSQFALNGTWDSYQDLPFDSNRSIVTP